MAKPVMPDYFAMWQRMFMPAAPQPSPMQSMQDMMFPDLESVERKLSELETVEGWLKTNLQMLQGTIKALEYQRAMLRSGERAREVFADANERNRTARRRRK